LLAASCAAFTVAGLAAAPELMRHRVGSGGWVVALQPVPWLTGAALALAALYALLAEGTATGTARHLFPAAERTQLALLTAPVAGICAIALAVTFPGGQAVTAAFRTAGAAGALSGVVILLAGLVAGYLAAGAVQLHAIAGTVTAPAARAALAAAAGHWALVAAAVTGAVAVAMACAPGRARGGRTGESAGGAPVLGAGGIPDHG
jgi:hypothetical protein